MLDRGLGIIDPVNKYNKRKLFLWILWIR